MELIMADLEMVNRRVEKAGKAAKGDKKFLHEAEVFRALAEHLNAGKSARTFDCGRGRCALATADLLSLKPIIYAANMDEAGFADCDSNPYFNDVKASWPKKGPRCCPSAPSWSRISPSWTTPRSGLCFWRSWGWKGRAWTG